MRSKGSLWQKVALYLGFACLLVAALRRPSEAARPSTERPDAPNPPAPRPRDNEKGSILARSVGLLFVATMVFALGAALGGAFAASADDGAPIEVGSTSTATDEATTGSDTTTEPVTSDETATSPQPEPTTSVVETTPAPGSTTQPVPAGGGSSSAHHPHSAIPTPAAPPTPQHAKRPHRHQRADHLGASHVARPDSAGSEARAEVRDPPAHDHPGPRDPLVAGARDPARSRPRRPRARRSRETRQARAPHRQPRDPARCRSAQPCSLQPSRRPTSARGRTGGGEAESRAEDPARFAGRPLAGREPETSSPAASTSASSSSFAISPSRSTR